MFTQLKYKLLHSKLLTVAIAGVILILFAAGGVVVFNQNKKTQVLRVGFNQFPPYLMVDQLKQKPYGLAALMIQEAARRANVLIRWVYVSSTADEALRTQKIDLFPILTVTDERKSAFYASQPWWENEIAIVSRESHVIQTVQDTTGARIAIRGMPVVKQLAETLFPGAHLVIVPEMDAMLRSLCAGELSGFFLDVRLLDSQLLKGIPNCPGGLHVASIPHGNLSLSTFSRLEKRWAADRIYEQLAQLAADGTLSQYASRWSLYNPFQSLHVKEGLEAKHRVELLRYGLGGMIVIVVLISFQTHRVRREQKATEAARQELFFRALHDPLTGLPNRCSFQSSLTQVLDDARQNCTTVAVLYLDLDGFKLVNDSLGHGVGDKLLIEVSGRLHACLRECDTLFRMGGDEFTLLLTKLPNEGSAQKIANRLLTTIQERFTIEGNELSITASVGVSLFPSDGLNGEELLQNADVAMYESKRQGKNRIRSFTPEMREAVREQLDLENYLRRALERKEFALHYQPEVCMKTGNIVKQEALLRWKHPVLGDIPPLKFIPIAEATTLIVPIGTWVLEEACHHASVWQKAGSKDVSVAVNVSLVQFGRPDFLEVIGRVLLTSGLPAHLLELELTESVVMLDLAEVSKKINGLRGLGVKISIDDFGTGYSCLSYLKQLSFDFLKIDRSFTSDIVSNADAVQLLESIIFIAHSLKMEVVVEGIETSGQLGVLRKIGCDIGQGYWFGRPSPIPAHLTLQAQIEEKKRKETLHLCA